MVHRTRYVAVLLRTAVPASGQFRQHYVSPTFATAVAKAFRYPLQPIRIFSTSFGLTLL